MELLYDYVCKMENVMVNKNDTQTKAKQLDKLKTSAFIEPDLSGTEYEILCKLYTAYIMQLK